MPKKKTLKGRFLQTGLLMLFLSLVIALVLVVVMLGAFALQAPGGESFVLAMVTLLKGEFFESRSILPYFVLGCILLSLSVSGLCLWLASRYTGRIADTLDTLRQAADNLRQGELDFEILSCQEQELDELSQSLEGVRQRLKAAAVAEAAAAAFSR